MILYHWRSWRRPNYRSSEVTGTKLYPGVPAGETLAMKNALILRSFIFYFYYYYYYYYCFRVVQPFGYGGPH